MTRSCRVAAGMLGLLLIAPGSRLEHAQLNLELRRMTPEGLESLLDAVRVEATVRECREFLDARERCQ